MSVMLTPPPDSENTILPPADPGEDAVGPLSDGFVEDIVTPLSVHL